MVYKLNINMEQWRDNIDWKTKNIRRKILSDRKMFEENFVKPKNIRRKFCQTATLSTTNPTWTAL